MNERKCLKIAKRKKQVLKTVKNTEQRGVLKREKSKKNEASVENGKKH